MQGAHHDEQLLSPAIQAYFHALAIVEPIRFQFWEDKGLTNAQIRVLYALRQEERLSVGQVADRLRVRPPTATGVVDRLVRQRLVRRRVSPSDRRVVEVSLTAAGRQLFDQIVVAGRAYLAAVLARMDAADVSAMTSLLGQFALQADALQRQGELTP